MNINQAFVLAAGYGTRMGEVGKHLPKPLWPIFETTLLGLQIHYIKYLGIEKIVVNIHHKHEKMKDYLARNFPDVQTSYEKDLLGSGGGVYKIINDGLIDQESPLALFNSDSFLMIEKKDWEGLAQTTYEREVSTGVFLSKISKDSHYNNVTFDKNGLMLSIESGEKTSNENYTYSGFGVVFPNRLKKNEGKLDFFTTVADYQNGCVFSSYRKPMEFIDLGTLPMYRTTLRSCLKEKQSKFRNFLEKFNQVNLQYIDEDKFSYHSSVKNQFNFSKNLSYEGQSDIVIGGEGEIIVEDAGVSLLA